MLNHVVVCKWRQFYYFPIWMPFMFFLFKWLQLELPVLCWIKMVKVYILVLFLILESFQIFTIEDSSCGLPYMTFIILRYITSIPTLLSIFIINRCWFLSNTFSVSIKMNNEYIIFFSLFSYSGISCWLIWKC